MIEQFTRALGAAGNCARFFVYHLNWDAAKGKFDKKPVGSAAEAKMTFVQAYAEAMRVRDTGQHATVGLWVTADSGLFFADVDKMPQALTLDARGTEVLAMFPGAFAEWSVGKHGIHVVGTLAAPILHGCKNDNLQLEFYTDGRGIALNIDSTPNGCMDSIHDATPLVTKYFAPRMPPTLPSNHVAQSPADDDELIQLMLAAKPSAEVAFNGKVSLASLWHGTAEKNSQNDASLASRLAFYTGCDAARMRHLMLRSGMVRPKWSTHRTYLDVTIQSAIANCTSVYTPRKKPPTLATATDASATVFNAADLLKREFRDVQWALRDILPEGVTIFSGDPKIGKSWFCLQAGFAVSTGSPMWNGRLPEVQGDVLYLSLEDNDRRLKRRLEKLIPKFPNIHSINRLHYSTEWPRAEEGVEKIAAWLREHPEARLVIIDTISAFRNNDPGRKTAYAHDYEVGQMLKPLSREFSCAIVLVMHNRKQQASEALHMVSGTQGLTGSVDNVLVLRKEGNGIAGLYVDGRDIEIQQELALKLEDGKWGCVGSVDAVKRSDARSAILEAITTLGSKGTAKEIHDATYGRSYPATRQMLARMVKDGELDKNGKLYTRGDAVFSGLPAMLVT